MIIRQKENKEKGKRLWKKERGRKRYRHEKMRKKHFDMQLYTRKRRSIMMWKDIAKDRISGGRCNRTRSKSRKCYRISGTINKRTIIKSKKSR